MKVRCIRTRNSRGELVQESSWYAVGKTYTVLALGMYDQSGIRLRILGDQPATPALFPLSDFEIVDGAIPKNWIVAPVGTGGFELTPAAWAQRGFWDRYFDGEPEAAAIFKREYDSISLGRELC